MKKYSLTTREILDVVKNYKQGDATINGSGTFYLSIDSAPVEHEIALENYLSYNYANKEVK